MHKDISLVTYTDFGQNMGRYAVGNTSELQTHLSATQGVQIVYTGGQDPVTLPHGMIDFGSASSAGNTALLGYNWMATVQHVNWGISTNYSGRYLGADNAIQYKEIVCWGSPQFNHNMQNDGSYTANSTDYRVSRINKLVTDVGGSALFYGNEASLNGQYLYRVGAGYTYKPQEDGSESYIGMPITGGMNTIDAVLGSNRYRLYVYYYDTSSDGVNETSPAPYNSNPGDSGSPSWVWNTATERYEYVGALEGATGNVANCYRGSDEWTKTIMEKYDVSAAVAGGSTLHMSAVHTQGETIADSQNSTTLYSGAVTDAAGGEIARYNGVRQGFHTWSDLSGLKDTQQWYAYGEEYMNSADVPMADLFYNSNLVFSSDSAEKVNIVLDDTVDLGVGYVQFKPTTAGASAEFDISSATGESNLLNSAGFIVEKGAVVHLNLTNPADFMREWRKVGEGDLYIEGSGNNDIFLNVGGAGKTYLNRSDGYAAYNVLVNNGSTVVINDIDQIKRDLTFGNRGGVLDMNGNSLNWNNDNDAAASGFTIHALDEQAIITNTKAGDGLKGAASTLTWVQGGGQTWLGSFVDTEAGALKFVYDGNPTGEADSRLAMHSIHTDLSHNANSGIEVWSGTLALQGRNTVHAENSLTGSGGTRYFHEDDWHYADAKANVTVLGGAFELGSHARLTGDVDVWYGTFIMREGVKHQMEYIEGGYVRENTDSIRDYFGLKGNVALASGTQMRVQFSEGTDSTLVYGGNITGSGNVTVELGVQASLYLAGENTFSGTKTLISGGLYVSSANGAGDTTSNKWLIGRDAWFAAETLSTTADIRAMIDTASTGVLALTHSITDDLTAAGYADIIVGAAEGHELHYGSADQRLTAIDGKWTLGGGGGNLIVDFLLEGDNMLVLGNEHGKGNVHLTNKDNSFSGGLSFAGGVTLTAENGALGNSAVALSYSNRLAFRNASMLDVLEQHSDGVLLVDHGAAVDIDLSTHPGLYIGSENDCRYTGNLTVAEGAAYRFGGSTGRFTVESYLGAGHDVIIDGQTYEGGTVALTNARAVDGQVTIIGRDSARPTSAGGNATLGFEGDNALANAAAFTVKDGGAIDLMGTRQTLNNLTLAASGTLKDSSGNGAAVLNGSATLEGSVTASHVVKTGDGDLSLGGTNNATRFEIQGGAATLMSGTATHAEGTLAVSNASLELNGQTVNGTIELGNGASLTNMSTVNTLHVVGDSQGSYRNADGSSTNAEVKVGSLTVDAGADFLMTTSTGYDSTTIDSLSGAGNVTLNADPSAGASVHYLATWIKGNNSSFTGNLTLNANGTDTGAYFSNSSSLGAGVVTFNGAQFYLQISNTAETAIQATLNVSGNVYLNEGGRGHVAYFTDLSGTGTLQSNSASTFLGDMTAYSGNIFMPARFGGAGSNYHAITGNNSSEAINLFATGARMSYWADYRFNYSDDVILNARVQSGNVLQSGTGTLVLSEANTSTGKLTINEGGTVKLADVGSWAGSLAGSGTLVHAGSADITITNISAFSGSLSLAEGSSLTLGTGATGSYSLNAGESLGVFAMGGMKTPATLNLGSLSLNGGELAFSAEVLVNGTHAALITNADIAAGSALTAQTISFSDTTALGAGEYLLASGDWSALSDTSFTINGISDYLNSTITASSSGLRLTLTQAEGIQLWMGTAEQSVWSTTSFGPAPYAAGNACFTDAAACKDITISGAVSASKLEFNAREDYSLTPEAGAGLTASELELNASGTVTLGSGVTITGASTLAAGSELVVKDFSTTGSTVTGAGTLSVDAGTASGSLSSDLTGLGTLRLLSGRYDTAANVIGGGNTAIEVQGGQLYVRGGTHANAITIGGAGWSGSDYADAALRLEGGTVLSGSLSLSSDATVAVTGSGATISGAVNTGDFTLTKTGAAALTLSGSNVSGNIVVNEGMLNITGAPVSGLKSLTLREDTTLKLGTAGAKFAAESIVMEDGSRIDLYNGNEDGALFSGNISFNGDVTIAGSNNGHYSKLEGSISGNGTLNLATTETNTWNIWSTVSDAKGGQLTVVVDSYVRLYGSNTYTGGTTVNGKTLTIGNEQALGGGALTINGGLVQQETALLLSTLDGSEGRLFTNGKQLTLGNGTTLADEATFSGTIDGNGSLVKIGEGTQVLSGTVTQASLNVESGTLALNGATVSGAVEVEEGGHLSLSGNLTLSHTITSAGTVSLEEGLHFNLSTELASYDADTHTYTIVSGGNISYAESGFSFTVDGISSADLDESYYTLGGASNNLTITIDVSDLGQEVTWNGSENNTWSTGSTSNWQQGNNTSSDFSSFDNVTFGSAGSHAVEVAAQGVKVESMTVTDAGYQFTGGAITSRGDMSIASGASADFGAAVSVDGTLTVAAGAGASFASGAELGALALTSDRGDTTLEFAGATTIGATYRTLGDKDNTAADNAVTITLANGSTVTDDGYWSMYGGSLEVKGKGVYKVNVICLSNNGSLVATNTWRGPQSSLTISEGATMVITGNAASNTDDIQTHKPSFDLGVWNTREDGADVRNQVLVNGSLISHAGFSVKDGKADVNVGEHGMLAMAGGLSLARTSGSVNVNVAGTLALGNTTQTSTASLSVTMKDGSTLAAWCGEDGTAAGNVSVNYGFQIEQDAALALQAHSGQSLTVGSDLSGAGSLAVRGGGDVALAASTSVGTVSSVQVEQGTRLSLKQGAAVSVGTNAASFAARTGSEAVFENVTATDASLSMTEALAPASVQGAQVSIAATQYSFANLEMQDSAVVAAVAEAVVTMQNVRLAQDVSVQGAASTDASTVTRLVAENLSLDLSRGTPYETENYAGGIAHVYTLDNFDSLSLSGSLTLNFVEPVMQLFALGATASAAEPDSIIVRFADSVDVGELALSLNRDGNTVTGQYLGNGQVVFSAIEGGGGAIPEPATAALSLLGLAALALRRRRK